MSFRLIVASLLLAAVAAACQSSPPTVVYVVVSPTPAADDTTSQQPTATLIASPAQTATSAPTVIPSTPTPAPTSLPEAFPTQTSAQIQVAEQVFENGRMFWLQPVSQIWVMVIDEEGSGRWLRYADDFAEGEDAEIDPDIVAPEGKIQPERGFGKLWRENPDVREALGWAITPEFGYISQYEYSPGGTIQDGDYVDGPGAHMLLSLNSEAFCFLEETGTWKLGC